MQAAQTHTFPESKVLTARVLCWEVCSPERTLTRWLIREPCAPVGSSSVNTMWKREPRPLPRYLCRSQWGGGAGRTRKPKEKSLDTVDPSHPGQLVTVSITTQCITKHSNIEFYHGSHYNKQQKLHIKHSNNINTKSTSSLD